jgi:hypothetical protein
MSSQRTLIRNQALKNLRQSTRQPSAEAMGQALLLALEQTGVDFKSGPSLDEVKTLLVDVSLALKQHDCGDGRCTAA